MNLRIGRISKWLTPHFSACGRCHTTWAYVREHVTDYSPSRGCFPLCEKCWRDLGTPEARMPYYRDLFERWSSDPEIVPTTEEWAGLEAAVMAGE